MFGPECRSAVYRTTADLLMPPREAWKGSFLNSEVGLSGCDVHMRRSIASIAVFAEALKPLHASYTP
jgi:hypothetical protein